MDWPSYFVRNRDSRIAIPWEHGIQVPDQLRRPLIRSSRALRCFHLPGALRHHIRLRNHG
jgi:hypothetical protein